MLIKTVLPILRNTLNTVRFYAHHRGRFSAGSDDTLKLPAVSSTKDLTMKCLD